MKRFNEFLEESTKKDWKKISRDKKHHTFVNSTKVFKVKDYDDLVLDLTNPNVGVSKYSKYPATWVTGDRIDDFLNSLKIKTLKDFNNYFKTTNKEIAYKKFSQLFYKTLK